MSDTSAPVIKIRTNVVQITKPIVQQPINPIVPTQLSVTNSNYQISTVITDKNPTITLRGVNVPEICKNYLDEPHIKNIEEYLQKIDLSYQTTSDHLENSTNYNDPIFRLKLTDTDKIYTNNVNIIHGGITKICQWCRVEIEPNVKPCGIPVRYIKHLDTYLLTRCYCGFPCAYAALKEILDRLSINIQPCYQNSEMLLLLLFRTIYPGKKLIAAPHWSLLENNMGSINRDEYYGYSYKSRGFNNYQLVDRNTGLSMNSYMSSTQNQSQIQSQYQSQLPSINYVKEEFVRV